MFTKSVVKKYHFLITICSPTLNIMGTFSGVIGWRGSRCEAFGDRFEYACKAAGTDPSSTYVWAWSFERDDL
jgi:hypothetical protein